MPRAVKGISGGLLGVAKDCMIELFGIDACPMNGFLAGNRRQIHGGELPQFTAITPHRRASTAYNCNLINRQFHRTSIPAYPDFRFYSWRLSVKFVTGVPPP